MRRILFVAALLTAGAALAHQGVQNPAVMARMEAMKIVGDNTKILGTMANGERAFDAATARAAAAEIAVQAGRTPDLFEAFETDPKSEALPAIWQSFGDFTDKAMAMQTAAEVAASGITSPDTLQAALRQIGATCKACHQAYRE